MRILRTLFKFREVGYVLLILGLGYNVLTFDRGSDLVPSGTEEPVVVVDSGGSIAREVAERAEEADKPRGIGERLGTREIKPDSIYVSLRRRGEEVPLPVDREYAVGEPHRLPSEALDWGIQEVVKEGPRLEVSALSRRTGSVERSIYTLSGEDSDFTIRSGNVATSVREDREFRFLRLGLALTTHGGLNPVTGAPTVQAILSGPVHVGTDHIRISPSVGAHVGTGLSVGVSARICLIGGCD